MTTNNPVNVNLSGQTGTANFVGSTAPTFTTSWAYAATGFIIKDNNGNSQITFTTTASAVNGFNFTNSITTVAPTFSAVGSDTNIGIIHQTKGTGNHVFSGGSGVVMLTLAPIASGVNSFSMTSATTGNGPTLNAAGSDSNVSMTLATNGTGSIVCTSNGTTSPKNLFTITPSTTPVNYLIVGSSNTGVAIPVTATGSDSNISISLNSKGTGGIDLKGYSDGSAASAGYVGELISSIVLQASAVTQASNGASNVTSIALTAGDWDIWGNASLVTAGSAPVGFFAWVSSSSATLPEFSLRSGFNSTATAISVGTGFSAPMLPFNVGAGGSTIYLSSYLANTSGAGTVCGRIYARRRR